MDPQLRLREAVSNGNLAITKRLLTRFPELWLNTDPRRAGWCNLHSAAYHGNYLVCFHLISIMDRYRQRAQLFHIDLVTFDNLTVLHLPIFKHHLQTLHLLLQEFSSPYWINYRGGPLLRTPLHYCCVHNFVDGLKLLLEFGADWALTDDNGDNGLHLCFAYDSVACMEHLVRFVATSPPPSSSSDTLAASPTRAASLRYLSGLGASELSSDTLGLSPDAPDALAHGPPRKRSLASPVNPLGVADAIDAGADTGADTVAAAGADTVATGGADTVATGGAADAAAGADTVATGGAAAAGADTVAAAGAADAANATLPLADALKRLEPFEKARNNRNYPPAYLAASFDLSANYPAMRTAWVEKALTLIKSPPHAYAFTTTPHLANSDSMASPLNTLASPSIAAEPPSSAGSDAPDPLAHDAPAPSFRPDSSRGSPLAMEPVSSGRKHSASLPSAHIADADRPLPHRRHSKSLVQGFGARPSWSLKGTSPMQARAPSTPQAGFSNPKSPLQVEFTRTQSRKSLSSTPQARHASGSGKDSISEPKSSSTKDCASDESVSLPNRVQSLPLATTPKSSKSALHFNSSPLSSCRQRSSLSSVDMSRHESLAESMPNQSGMDYGSRTGSGSSTPVSRVAPSRTSSAKFYSSGNLRRNSSTPSALHSTGGMDCMAKRPSVKSITESLKNPAPSFSALAGDYVRRSGSDALPANSRTPTIDPKPDLKTLLVEPKPDHKTFLVEPDNKTLLVEPDNKTLLVEPKADYKTPAVDSKPFNDSKVSNADSPKPATASMDSLSENSVFTFTIPRRLTSKGKLEERHQDSPLKRSGNVSSISFTSIRDD